MQAKRLVELSAQERAKARLHVRLEKLGRRKPENAHGLLAFKISAEGAHLIAHDAGIDNGERCPLARTRARTTHVAAAWQVLPPERRVAHEAFARARSAAMRGRIEDEAADIRDEIAWSDRRGAQELAAIGLLAFGTTSYPGRPEENYQHTLRYTWARC